MIPVHPEQILEAHQLYCQLTGQKLSLGFARERMWFELLRLGYGPEQLQSVIRYLQREIRHARRNVGALKLSNLLQPDRFEEDLNIATVLLNPPKAPRPLPAQAQPMANPQALEQRRLTALAQLQALKTRLEKPSTP
jgi:hypothetical protein